MNTYGKITPELPIDIYEIKKDIILFDPIEVYKRISIQPFNRTQTISIKAMFPNEYKELCACGCGKKLIGRQTRWYSDECTKVPLGVYWVIKGDLGYIKSLMMEYLPYCCGQCGKESYQIEKKGTLYNGREFISFSAAGVQVDHILPVKNGGAGGWLGNYQFLCHKCNTGKNRKTNI